VVVVGVVVDAEFAVLGALFVLVLEIGQRRGVVQGRVSDSAMGFVRVFGAGMRLSIRR
jgi:hypothetical protein